VAEDGAGPLPFPPGLDPCWRSTRQAISVTRHHGWHASRARARTREPSRALAHAYWTSLAEDPLATLLFMALMSLAGVLVVLLWYIAVYLFGQLAAAVL
jgi:hypothetical protein